MTTTRPSSPRAAASSSRLPAGYPVRYPLHVQWTKQGSLLVTSPKGNTLRITPADLKGNVGCLHYLNRRLTVIHLTRAQMATLVEIGTRVRVRVAV